MEKKLYQTPTVETVKFEDTEVLAGSGGGGSLPQGVDAEPFGARSGDLDGILEEIEETYNQL